MKNRVSPSLRQSHSVYKRFPDWRPLSRTVFQEPVCSERLLGAEQLNIAITASHHAPLQPPDVPVSDTTHSPPPSSPR